MRFFLQKTGTPLLAVGVFLCDRMCKFIAVAYPGPYYVLSPYIGFELYQNPGVAFSVPIAASVMVWLSPLLLFFLWYLFLRLPQGTLARFGFALIMTGAVSNYIDRMMVGYTIDYIRVFTAVLNLADVAIVVGVLLWARLVAKTTRP